MLRLPVVGGVVAILFSARLHRVGSVFVFLGAGCSGLIGVSLIANALRVHGSSMGDFLIGASGILFLMISPALVPFGIAVWKKAEPRTQND